MDVSDPIAAGTELGAQPRVGQLMMLIAAAVIGIVGIWDLDAGNAEFDLGRRDLPERIAIYSPMLISLSMAVMAAGLWPPRSRPSDPCQRPGFTACWVALLVTAINAVAMFAMDPDSLTTIDKFIRRFEFVGFWMTAADSGFAVLIAWTTLALSGCWRPEPSWIDRSGRVLGVVWITAFVARRIGWMMALP